MFGLFVTGNFFRYWKDKSIWEMMLGDFKRLIN